MLRTALLGLVAPILIPALAAQVPLGFADCHREDGRHCLDYEDWGLDTQLPNSDATDNLVFETVHSLLQHWPNTRMRNGRRSVRLSGFSSNTYSPPGHNIVPGSIPTGTLLYHGTLSKELPPGPEWVATDPEHSYNFCRDKPGSFQQVCWQLTLAAARPLKVIYFDGNSAAKLPYGSMDTQDLIAWGRPGDHNDEYRRSQDLCQWGKKFGVDGFVR